MLEIAIFLWARCFFFGFACVVGPKIGLPPSDYAETIGMKAWQVLFDFHLYHLYMADIIWYLGSDVRCPVVFHQARLVLDPLALEALQESMRIPVLRQNIETANSALTSRHHVHESCASITKTFYEPLCHCSKAELAFQNLISDKSCNAKDAKAYFMARLKSSTLCCPVHGTHVRKSPNECPVGLWILLQTRNMLDFDCLHLENFLQHSHFSLVQAAVVEQLQSRQRCLKKSHVHLGSRVWSTDLLWCSSTKALGYQPESASYLTIHGMSRDRNSQMFCAF